MNATSRTARIARTTSRRAASRLPRWEVVVYHSIGFGGYRGPGYSSRTEAMAAAELLELRLGQVAAVVANVAVEVDTYARLLGADGRRTWVPNPSTTDIIAATREIEPGYARQLWTTLAERATSAGRVWTCAYVNSADQAVAYPWSERVDLAAAAPRQLAA